jgi:hypothetical protein
VDTPELTLDNGKPTTLDPKRPEDKNSGQVVSAVIQEVDMEDWDVDGLPAAEHRRLATSQSG